VKIVAIDTVQVAEFPSLVFVRVHTDAGLVGLGETFFHADAVAAHVHSGIAPHLLGTDPHHRERHARDLVPYVGSTSSGAEMRAASAIDIALWDVCGQAAGQPLHQLLGGASRDAVRMYNTCAGYRYVRAGYDQAVDNWGLPGAETQAEGPYEDLDAFLHRAGDLACDLLSQGITAMKIWPFDPYAERTGGHHITSGELEAGLEPLRKIRAAVGMRMDVMIELHALWDVPSACRIVHALEPLAPFWIEDPVRVTNAAAMAEVQAATATPIAAGETIASLAAFRDLLAAGGARIAILDIGWVGGITQARKVAALAEAFERPVAPHDCTGPVVYTACSHLSLHLPNVILQEHVRAFATGWYTELVTALPALTAGMITPPSGAGLGTALRPEVLERADVTIRTTDLVKRP
jgi:galactonate dehydratase